GHLLGVVEDVMAGRLTTIPTAEQTEAQAARHRGRPMAEMVDQWSESAPAFEKAIAAAGVWPAVMDVATHEQDIRGAIGRPGARDSDVVQVSTERLITTMRPPVPLRVVCEDLDARVGPGEGDTLTLRTTRFEAFRWRLGRRSRAQMERFDWSADPAPVLDHLVVFGPATLDVLE
ncbi:MAG TPA: hypothetical protein VGR90_01960, partial [Acidimicrobiales bacterium]|nr:hypothetical protein [Acidimicrobiales bacterium]